MNKTKNYKYVGKDLDWKICRELLIELFDGKMFYQHIAIEKIMSFHKSSGGLISRGLNLQYIFLQAARRLLKESAGLIKWGDNIWELHYQKEGPIFCNYDEVIGEGKDQLYVYYYDSVANTAKTKGCSFWKCFIGKTILKDNLLDIALQQHELPNREHPHIALIIKCDDLALTQSTIHSILKMKNRTVTDAKQTPIKNCFMTTPEEIKEIYNFILGND